MLAFIHTKQVLLYQFLPIFKSMNLRERRMLLSKYTFGNFIGSLSPFTDAQWSS